MSSIGVIVAAVAALAGLAVLLFGAWWRGAYQVAATQAEELRKALTDERTRAERAETRERETLQILSEQKETIARLEALPDLSKILEFLSVQEEQTAKRTEHAVARVGDLIAAHEQRVEDRYAQHEERAQDRHEAQIAVLAGMAANLERLAQRAA